MRVAVHRVRAHPDLLEQLRDARLLVGSRLGELVDADRLAHDLAHRHARVQARVRVLEDDLHPAAQRPQLALRAAASRSLPSKTTRPKVGSSRRSMSRPSVLLPQPLSPTRPIVSPAPHADGHAVHGAHEAPAAPEPAGADREVLGDALGRHEGARPGRRRPPSGSTELLARGRGLRRRLEEVLRAASRRHLRLHARQQRDEARPGATSASGGSSLRAPLDAQRRSGRRSGTRRQRARGRAPCPRWSAGAGCRWRLHGAARSRAGRACRGASGRANRSFTGALSTTRPAYMTTTCSAFSATTPEVVRDEQDAHRQPLLELAQELQDLRLDGHVERGGRLVGDAAASARTPAPSRSSRAAAAARELVGVGVHAASPAPGCPPGRAARTARARASPPRLLLVQAHRLDDLPAHRVDRVEAGHRLLEDHRDRRCRGPARISRSGSFSRSRPSSSIAPDSMRPGGEATRRRIDSAVTLLPHPLSPTSATVVARGHVERHARRRPAAAPSRSGSS